MCPAQSKLLRAKYAEHLNYVHGVMSTVKELTPIVFDRYIYKGRDIEVSAKKTLKKFLKYTDQIQNQSDIKEFIVFDQAGQGELSLLLALMYPDSSIYCYPASPETREILRGCIEDFVRNVHISDKPDVNVYSCSGTKIYEIMQDTELPRKLKDSVAIVL